MSDAYLRDQNGVRYATKEAAERANARIKSREAELAKEAASNRARLESSLQNKFLQAGGTDAEFQAVKADLVRDALQAAALQPGDDDARRANADRYRV